MALRPPLGATLPPAQAKWFNADGTPTMDAWRFFERLQAMQADDPAFMLESMRAADNTDIDELRAEIAGLRADSAAAFEAAARAQEAAEEAQSLQVAAIDSVIPLIPNGALAGVDILDRDGASDDFAGVVARAFSSSADWVKSSVTTPTKALTDYETLTLTTDVFKVRPGDQVEVAFSYKNQGVRDMYEHFSHAEKVEILTAAGSNIVTLNDDVYPAWSSANTGYCPTGWTGEVNIRHAEIIPQSVPDPISGAWPTDRRIKVRMTLTPDASASGGGADCIAGGTFTAADVKTYFKCVNRRILVRVIPKEITEILS